jgi:hypothetical protein
MNFSFDVRPDAERNREIRAEAERSVDEMLHRVRNWPRVYEYEARIAERLPIVAGMNPTLSTVRIVWKCYRQVAALAQNEKTA